MNQQPLRIGIIGAGNNTRKRHIPGFQEIDGVEITTVANRSRESSEKVAAQFGIPAVAGHWREVIESPDVDAVMIGTWPYLHREASVAALEAGKHVLTEARMAMNVEEAEAMLAASRKHPELVAQIVPAPMSLDVDATVRELVDAGELGKLREVGVTHTAGQHADPSAPLTWRQNRKLSGVNMLSLGIYHEMVLRWVEGDPEDIQADGQVFTPRRRDPETGEEVEVEIPESVSVLGRFPGGLRLVYHFSGVEPVQPRNEMRLNGSKAGLRFDVAGQKLFLARIGGREDAVDVPPERRRGWQVEADFVASIREGKPVELTRFETGLRYMKFTEAVWNAVKGRP